MPTDRPTPDRSPTVADTHDGPTKEPDPTFTGAGPTPDLDARERRTKTTRKSSGPEPPTVVPDRADGPHHERSRRADTDPDVSDIAPTEPTGLSS